MGGTETRQGYVSYVLGWGSQGSSHLPRPYMYIQEGRASLHMCRISMVTPRGTGIRCRNVLPLHMRNQCVPGPLLLHIGPWERG